MLSSFFFFWCSIDLSNCQIINETWKSEKICWASCFHSDLLVTTQKSHIHKYWDISGNVLGETRERVCVCVCVYARMGVCVWERERERERERRQPLGKTSCVNVWVNILLRFGFGSLLMTTENGWLIITWGRVTNTWHSLSLSLSLSPSHTHTLTFSLFTPFISKSHSAFLP